MRFPEVSKESWKGSLVGILCFPEVMDAFLEVSIDFNWKSVALLKQHLPHYIMFQ